MLIDEDTWKWIREGFVNPEKDTEEEIRKYLSCLIEETLNVVKKDRSAPRKRALYAMVGCYLLRRVVRDDLKRTFDQELEKILSRAINIKGEDGRKIFSEN